MRKNRIKERQEIFKDKLINNWIKEKEEIINKERQKWVVVNNKWMIKEIKERQGIFKIKEMMMMMMIKKLINKWIKGIKERLIKK